MNRRYFTTTILSLYFLSYLQRASSSQDLLIVSDDQDVDVAYLEKFFNEFEKAYLRKQDYNYIVIVGSDNNDLRQVNPVFKGSPYSVYSDVKLSASQKFGHGTFLIIFLVDMSEEAFGKKIEGLSRCRGCKVLFVAHGAVTIDEVLLTFKLATK